MQFLADENFHPAILLGVRRSLPHLDIVRVQDMGLYSASDQDILAWAAEQKRILLTHDARTVPMYARRRIEAGLRMPGVVLVNKVATNAALIDDLAILLDASTEDEFAYQIRFVPLR